MDANHISITMDSLSVNESFARMAVAAFITPLDPTYGELSDIKTAVSEAVTNCIVHGYFDSDGEIYLTAQYYDDNVVKITVKDKGRGIENVKQAMEPLFTTDGSGERSGMGFPIMQTFMDKVKVISKPGRGTTIIFSKKINK
jgi:stage II sporulation protein AB (anti-sigma F factor)